MTDHGDHFITSLIALLGSLSHYDNHDYNNSSTIIFQLRLVAVTADSLRLYNVCFTYHDNNDMYIPRPWHGSWYPVQEASMDFRYVGRQFALTTASYPRLVDRHVWMLTAHNQVQLVHAPDVTLRPVAATVCVPRDFPRWLTATNTTTTNHQRGRRFKSIFWLIVLKPCEWGVLAIG